MKNNEIVQAVVAFSIRLFGCSMFIYGILNNLLYVIESYIKYGTLAPHDHWVLFRAFFEIILGIILIRDPRKVSKIISGGIFKWEDNENRGENIEKSEQIDQNKTTNENHIA